MLTIKQRQFLKKKLIVGDILRVAKEGFRNREEGIISFVNPDLNGVILTFKSAHDGEFWAWEELDIEHFLRKSGKKSKEKSDA